MQTAKWLKSISWPKAVPQICNLQFAICIMQCLLLISPAYAFATDPTTTASHAGGTYNTSQSVTLTSDEPSAIYYTTNGETPTTGSTVYSSPIDISSDTTMKFFAIDVDDNEEAAIMDPAFKRSCAVHARGISDNKGIFASNAIFCNPVGLQVDNGRIV